MKRENFYFAICAFLVIAVCAIAAIKVFAGEHSLVSPPEKKKHSSVKIDKSLISTYKAEQGVRMVLSFKETAGGHVKLSLTGFRDDGSVCLDKELQTVKNNVLSSRNVFFGIISQDESGKPLHDLFAAGTEQDWVLTPVPYDGTGNYVSYELSNENEQLAAAVSRLNPSPPAR